MLKKMGAIINVYDDTIIIKGVNELKGTNFFVASDRIEAGSYILLACSVKESDVTIENINYEYLEEVIKTVEQLGVKVQVEDQKIRIIKKYPIKGIYKKASYFLIPYLLYGTYALILMSSVYFMNF